MAEPHNPLDDVRVELGVIIGVAADLARRGDTAPAVTLKDATDSLRRTLCNHHGEATKHLSMRGPFLCCRHCGKEVDPAVPFGEEERA